MLTLCERCNSSPLFFRVRSEILNVRVCVECGVKAAGLGLIVTELSREQKDVPPSVIVPQISNKSA